MVTVNDKKVPLMGTGLWNKVATNLDGFTSALSGIHHGLGWSHHTNYVVACPDCWENNNKVPQVFTAESIILFCSDPGHQAQSSSQKYSRARRPSFRVTVTTLSKGVGKSVRQKCAKLACIASILAVNSRYPYLSVCS
jgi:hypothetical protein